MEHYFTNNDNLKSEYREIKYKIQNSELTFTSDNGVFSKDNIDYGSRVLVDNIISNTKSISNMLDVGCGYGFIGITISKILGVHADMIDINARAIHLCEMNIKTNKVDSNAYISNIYENVSNKYDLIVSNPPIRAGKKVILDILRNAKKHLNNYGTLWYVIRKDQGAKSITKSLENDYNIRLVEKNKGYFIYEAKNKDTN